MTINTKFRALLGCFTVCLLLAACGSDDDAASTPDDNADLPKNETWVIYNSSTGWSGGIYALKDNKAREIDLTGLPFVQVASSLGGRYTDGFLYKVNDETNGIHGVTQFKINAAGNVEKSGFLNGENTAYETNYLVVSKTEGYYWSRTRGTLKIQTFNPTTMERTGEIDFSAVATGEPFESVGQMILAKRDDKLYVDVIRGVKDPANWQVTLAKKEAAIAVYNLTTKKVEGVTTFPKTQHVGVFIDHVLYSIDEKTNDIYFVAVGDMKNQSQELSSKILRIKSGETTFDPNFSIDITKYQYPAEFNRLFVHNGKIYTTIPARAVSYYGGGQHGVRYRDDVWFWNEIDAATGRATRLSLPPDNFYNTQNPFLHNGEIYFSSNNTGDGFAGVNQYNPETGVIKETFRLKGSGRMMGFMIIPD